MSVVEETPHPPRSIPSCQLKIPSEAPSRRWASLVADFFNSIDPIQTWRMAWKALPITSADHFGLEVPWAGAEDARGDGRCEMEDDADAALRYRQRAEEMRVIAHDMTDSTSREILIRIAESYERMSRQMDQSAAVDRVRSRIVAARNSN